MLFSRRRTNELFDLGEMADPGAAFWKPLGQFDAVLL